MFNNIEYTNRLDLIFSLINIEEYTWFKDKYKEIFIDDLKYQTKVKDILGFIPNSYEEFFNILKTNKELKELVQSIFNNIYKFDDSITLITDISGNTLYKVDGSQSAMEAELNKYSDIQKIYTLSPNVEDYKDIFNHEIKFKIYDDFIK